MSPPSADLTARELVGTVELSDGMTVAIGGAGLQRKPMALLRALVAAGANNLVVVSYLGSVDVEFLLASGVVAEVHSAGVGLDGFGLAPAFRRARQSGSVRWVEWSEGSLLGALEASSRGLPSMPVMTDPRSDITRSEWLRTVVDPFTGADVVHARALAPDLALLHASSMDSLGNLYYDGDEAIDGVLARAATHTLATASCLVDADPERVAVPSLWVDEAMVDPDAPWPTGCEPATLIDVGAVAAWAKGDGTEPTSLSPSR